MQKPKLSFWQIWNLSFGFLGIQFGFALQNANASRILQNFGADVHELSWFWLVAPITGLVVQPIIGHYSDRTWNGLGRRKPYFLAGALLAAAALTLLPNANVLAGFLPVLLIGAGMLMIMDASFNVAMEPFRALVADMLPDEQRTMGFSVQTFLIGLGAVAGSWLPYILANWLGFDKPGAEGGVADNVIISFYVGAAVLLGAILVTIVSTKEYPPQEYKQYFPETEGEEDAGFAQIFKDFVNMPAKMKQLGGIQFLSWFALFGMWVFTTPAIAQHIYGLDVHDAHSETYNKAADWVGVIFGVYNAISAVYALLLPAIAKATSRKFTHAVSLAAGGLGLLSFFIIDNPDWLLLPMIGVGMAWASILAMPYAMLAGSIPAGKMGVYMGIFNFFIVIPQIVNGLIGGPMVKYVYGERAIFALVIAGISMLLAALLTLRLRDGEEAVRTV
ncbi:MFS transporter [bacterium]|nr:MFS transporter [bacterium]